MERFRDTYRTDSVRLPGHDYAAPGWYFVTICTAGRAPFFGRIRNGVMGLSPAGCIAAREWQRTPQVRPYVRLDAWVVMPNHMHGLIGITAHTPADDRNDDDRNGDSSETVRRDDDGRDGDNGRNGDSSAVETLRRDDDDRDGDSTAVRTVRRGDNGRDGDNGRNGDSSAVETLRRNVSTKTETKTKTETETTPTQKHRPRNRTGPKNERMAAISPDAGSLPVIVRAYKSVVTRCIRRAVRPGFGWQPRFYDRVVRDDAERRRIRRYIRANPRRWWQDRAHPDRP